MHRDICPDRVLITADHELKLGGLRLAAEVPLASTIRPAIIRKGEPTGVGFARGEPNAKCLSVNCLTAHAPSVSSAFAHRSKEGLKGLQGASCPVSNRHQEALFPVSGFHVLVVGPGHRSCRSGRCARGANPRFVLREKR